MSDAPDIPNHSDVSNNSFEDPKQAWGLELLRGSSSSVRPPFEPPADVAALIKAENIAERGQGPNLSGAQSAHLDAWRTFPNPADMHYRKLEETYLLNQKHLGPPLSPAELEKLESGWHRPLPGQGEQEKRQTFYNTTI